MKLIPEILPYTLCVKVFIVNDFEFLNLTIVKDLLKCYTSTDRLEPATMLFVQDPTVD